MFEMTGRYSKATILTDLVEPEAQAQIQAFLNHPAFEDSNIAIMPDVHAGKGSVIGFTATVKGFVIPNVVGVDIGCGVLAYKIPKHYAKGRMEDLEAFIRKYIPTGFAVRPDYKKAKGFYTLSSKILKVCNETDQDYHRVMCSIGTLGGGNHFIEIDFDQNGDWWLVIHTGSRGFGLKVAGFHQRKAKEYTQRTTGTNTQFKDLEYMPIDEGGQAYLEHMRVAQEFAEVSRHIIAEDILEGFFGFNPTKIGAVRVESVHNFIDFTSSVPIIRKGAISAKDGESVLIPLNMAAGTIIGFGKSPEKYNFSAPHGAGRKLSRSKAKKTLSMDKFKQDMAGVSSWSVHPSTLDEAPDAYKDAEEIISCVGELVDMVCIMKPVYNLKDCAEIPPT